MAEWGVIPDANKNPSVCINSFRDEFRFLSNMYGCNIRWHGITYPSAEHAYVAAKVPLDGTLIPILHRIKIAKIAAPGKAKKYGQKLPLAPNWNEIRLEYMREIVFQKFYQNQYLAEKLLQTGTAELVEGNWWKDFYWGICDGVGENHLGRILMQVRENLPKIWAREDLIAEAEFCGG